MLNSRKGTLRHPKFDECVDRLVEISPRAREAIDGAIWLIERQPTTAGILIAELGVRYSRVVLPDDLEVLLIYSISRRLITMLTIIPPDDLHKLRTPAR